MPESKSEGDFDFGPTKASVDAQLAPAPPPPHVHVIGDVVGLETILTQLEKNERYQLSINQARRQDIERLAKQMTYVIYVLLFAVLMFAVASPIITHYWK